MQIRNRSTLAVALLVLCACSSIKNTPGGRPPDSAFCDQIDFGAGSVWVCAGSPALLLQQRDLAAKTRTASVPQ